MFKFNASDETYKKWAEEESDYDISAGPEITTMNHVLNLDGSENFQLMSLVPLKIQNKCKKVNSFLSYFCISIHPRFVVFSCKEVKVKWKTVVTFDRYKLK